jgi:hypothetical protein
MRRNGDTTFAAIAKNASIDASRIFLRRISTRARPQCPRAWHITLFVVAEVVRSRVARERVVEAARFHRCARIAQTGAALRPAPLLFGLHCRNPGSFAALQKEAGPREQARLASSGGLVETTCGWEASVRRRR